MNNHLCPVCGEVLISSMQKWHYRCDGCRYEKGDLAPAINNVSLHQLIDEPDREIGLREVRVGNFRKLLEVITALKPSGKLLDVGCAHGWFVEQALNDFDALGLEPDANVYNNTIKKNIPVRMGYFPDALEDFEKFDVIVFNDVIEHIPDIEKVLDACAARLNEGGLLVLNLPSSDGVFYRVARLFGKMGKTEFFDRLWQKDLPSPHVHYFNVENLALLLRRCQFAPIESGTLPTLGLKGLYTRISYTGNLGLLSRLLIYGLIAMSVPVLRLLPSDIVYIVAKKA
ncbi:class I SAM-dependent methyltransferase [Pseudomonas atacamensis]|jgi:SAM-dependent methyltransferase|uniref:class I SAM-dependent methyltransferase n=1 Tax=Pseudomonas atacamensis TaxID=2565368 RepID=UPI003207CA76